MNEDEQELNRLKSEVDDRFNRIEMLAQGGRGASPVPNNMDEEDDEDDGVDLMDYLQALMGGAQYGADRFSELTQGVPPRPGDPDYIEPNRRPAKNALLTVLEGLGHVGSNIGDQVYDMAGSYTRSYPDIPVGDPRAYPWTPQQTPEDIAEFEQLVSDKLSVLPDPIPSAVGKYAGFSGRVGEPIVNTPISIARTLGYRFNPMVDLLREQYLRGPERVQNLAAYAWQNKLPYGEELEQYNEGRGLFDIGRIVNMIPGAVSTHSNSPIFDTRTQAEEE